MQLKNMSIAEKLLVILMVAFVIVFIGHELKIYLPDLELWIEKLGVFAPFGFIVLFIVLTPLLVSVDTLCFTAGILFPIGDA